MVFGGHPRHEPIRPGNATRMHKDNGSEGSAFAREDCTLLTRSFLMVLDDVESRWWPTGDSRFCRAGRPATWARGTPRESTLRSAREGVQLHDLNRAPVTNESENVVIPHVQDLHRSR